LDFVSTTNRNVAITFPKCPGIYPNFDLIDLWPPKNHKLTLKFSATSKNPAKTVFVKKNRLKSYFLAAVALSFVLVTIHPVNQLSRNYQKISLAEKLSRAVFLLAVQTIALGVETVRVLFEHVLGGKHLVAVRTGNRLWHVFEGDVRVQGVLQRALELAERTLVLEGGQLVAVEFADVSVQLSSIHVHYGFAIVAGAEEGLGPVILSRVLQQVPFHHESGRTPDALEFLHWSRHIL